MKDNLKVAVSNFSPLIINENGKYVGFEIDIWEEITKNSGMNFQYEQKEFQEIIPSLIDKKVDVVLAGITINEKREKVIDFSHATLNSGLLVLVDKNRNKIDVVKSIIFFVREGYKAIISPFLLVLLFLAVFSNLLWLAERSVKTFSHNYFPGIFEAAWLVICSMSTDSFGDYVPHTWMGRIITTGIIIGGVALFGLFIAQISAFITIKKIKGDIGGYRDLVNKKVATIKDSTSINALQKLGAKVFPTSNLQEACERLKNHEVDAVVFDAPVIEYFLKNEGGESFEIVGELFDKQNYGIALQSGSKLREKINQAFLLIKESGRYDIIYRKWFGENSIMEL